MVGLNSYTQICNDDTNRAELGVALDCFTELFERELIYFCASALFTIFARSFFLNGL